MTTLTTESSVEEIEKELHLALSQYKEHPCGYRRQDIGLYIGHLNRLLMTKENNNVNPFKDFSLVDFLRTYKNQNL